MKRTKQPPPVYTPDPRFALPDLEHKPCELCGRDTIHGTHCQECREYVRMFRFDQGGV